MNRLTFTFTDPDNPEDDTTLTVNLAGEELTYLVDAFRRFLLAQQFAESAINKHLGEQEQ